MRRPEDFDLNSNRGNDYEEFKDAHRDEILRSAVAAIDPDVMRMDREQAMTLAGAMKACGFSREEFAAVMSKSSADKGTFAKQWDYWTGKGKHGAATEGTIYKYAQLCGWSWPAPNTDSYTAESPAGKRKAPAPTLLTWNDGFTVSCLMDSVGYTAKPANVWEIRNREPLPTPQPTAFTIQEFARAVTAGRTFYPTVYSKEQTGRDENGKPKYTYRAISQQLFVVDIDNEEQYIDESGKRGKRRIKNPLTIDAALEICSKHDIAPFFVYETFSSKAHRDDPTEPYTKFRLCFALDEPLTVQEVGERGLTAAVDYFISLFGAAADSKTTDSARLIYGTDEKDRATLYQRFLKKDKLLPTLLAPHEELPEEEPEDTRDDLDKFFDMISSEAYKPISTGLNWIDDLLGGGIISQTILLLLAAPGSGKTILCQQIAENMARQHKPVIYLNYEMSREQMLARALSHRLAKTPTPKTTTEILQGYKWTDEERAAIKAAKDAYRGDTFQYIKYNPANISTDLKAILQYLHKAGEEARAAGQPAPAVVVDYLQLISSDKNLDVKELTKQAITGLKQYAMEFDTFVIAIVATNRTSNESGSITQSSGRDSSNIEYTGDYMLSLNYYEIENGTADARKQTDMDRLQQENPRRMMLRVLKSRFGVSGKTTNVYLNAAYNTYYGESEFIPTDDSKTPFYQKPAADNKSKLKPL